MSTEAGLVAHALRWHRGGRRIVDGVSLEVPPGEIVGLLGPNGAGKTVTLSMIAGLLNVTSGHVRIDGEDVTELPLHLRARRGLGFLPQERSIFTKMSVEQNVTAILEARGYRGSQLRAKARVLLDEFGLAPLARSRAIQLSGGEQRRLEVARSLASDPRYLLFDEPFAGIDPLTIESLHLVLVRLRERGVGVLLTDHNVRETLALCDRTYVLYDGVVLAEGRTPDLVMNPEVRQRFLGEFFDEFGLESPQAAPGPPDFKREIPEIPAIRMYMSKP